MPDTTDPTIATLMGKGRSVSVATIIDVAAPERDIKLRVLIDRYSTEPKVEFLETLPTGKKVSQKLYFGGVSLGKTVSELVQAVQEYLATDLPAGSPGWKIEALPTKKPKPAREKKAASAEHPILAELREKLARIQKVRFKTRNDEVQIERINAILAARPDRWAVGTGVGWRVTANQINRGFRIVAVHPDTKQADIVQVADTGLTHTGGDDPLTGETHRVWMSDLIRDKKYDAPKTTSGSVSGREEEYLEIDQRLRLPRQQRLTDLDVRELLHPHSAPDTDWPAPGEELFLYPLIPRTQTYPDFRYNLGLYITHVVPDAGLEAALESALDLVWQRVPEFIFRLEQEFPSVPAEPGTFAGLEHPYHSDLQRLLEWLRSEGTSLVSPGWSPPLQRAFAELVSYYIQLHSGADPTREPDAVRMRQARRAGWAAWAQTARRPWDTVSVSRVLDVMEGAILSELGTFPFFGAGDLSTDATANLSRIGAASQRGGFTTAEAEEQQRIILDFLHRWWDLLRSRFAVATIYRNVHVRQLTEQLVLSERARSLGIALRLVLQDTEPDPDTELRSLKPEFRAELLDAINRWLDHDDAGPLNAMGDGLCQTVSLGMFEAAAWEPVSWLMMSTACAMSLAGSRSESPAAGRRQPVPGAGAPMNAQTSRSIFLHGLGAALIAVTGAEVTSDAIKMRTDPFLYKEVAWLSKWWAAVREAMPETAERLAQQPYPPTPPTTKGPPVYDELLESLIHPPVQHVDPLKIGNSLPSAEKTGHLPGDVEAFLEQLSPTLQQHAVLWALQKAWRTVEARIDKLPPGDWQRDIRMEASLARGLQFVERMLTTDWSQRTDRDAVLEAGRERYPEVFLARDVMARSDTVLPETRQLYFGLRLLLAAMADEQPDQHGNPLTRAVLAAMRGALRGISGPQRLPTIERVSQFYGEWIAETKQRLAMRTPRSAEVSGPREDYQQIRAHLAVPRQRVLTPRDTREILSPRNKQPAHQHPDPGRGLFPTYAEPDPRDVHLPTEETLHERLQEWLRHFVADDYMWLATEVAAELVWQRVPSLLHALNANSDRLSPEAGSAVEYLLGLIRGHEASKAAPGYLPPWGYQEDQRFMRLLQDRVAAPELRQAWWASYVVSRRLKPEETGIRARAQLENVVRAAIASEVGESYLAGASRTFDPAPDIDRPTVPLGPEEAVYRRGIALLGRFARAYRSRLALFTAVYSTAHISRLSRVLSYADMATLISVAARMVRSVQPEERYYISEVMSPEEQKQLWGAIDAWLDRRDPDPAEKEKWLCDVVMRGFEEYRKWDPRLWVAFSAVALITWANTGMGGHVPMHYIFTLAMAAALRAGVTHETRIIGDQARVGPPRFSEPELRWLQAWWGQSAGKGKWLRDIDALPSGPAPPPVAGPPAR